MIKLPFKKKKVTTKNFFDFPAKEQKKIIIKAAQEAEREQKELVDKFNRLYSSQKAIN